MVNTIRFAAVLLPALVLAQQNTVVSVTVNGQVTSYELPAFTAAPAPAPATTEAAPAPAPPAESEATQEAATPESPDGTSIPVTLANQQTTVVLPYWTGSAAVEQGPQSESAPGTTVVPLPLPVPIPTSAIGSVVSSVISGASSQLDSLSQAASGEFKDIPPLSRSLLAY